MILNKISYVYQGLFFLLFFFIKKYSKTVLL